jgi:hypothetical protein
MNGLRRGKGGAQDPGLRRSWKGAGPRLAPELERHWTPACAGVGKALDPGLRRGTIKLLKAA